MEIIRGLSNFAYLLGKLGGQTFIGGTGVTDILKLQGTTGNGTLTSPAIQFLVGNNGGTVAATFLNNGNVGYGITAPDFPLAVYSSDSAVTCFASTHVNGVYTTFKNSATAIGYVGSSGAIITSGSTSDFAISSNAGKLVLGTGQTNRVLIDTSGNIGVGQSSFGTSAAKVLAIGSGTAPSTSPADCVQLWSADRGGTAGKAGLHWRAEDGTIGVIGDYSGFGTASPTCKLQIKDVDTATPLRINADTGLIRFRPYVNSVGGAYIESMNVAEDVYLPLTLVGSNILLFGGNIGVGQTTFGTSAAKVLAIGSGTAPSTSPADSAQLWVADRNGIAGKASFYFRQEDDTAAFNITPLYGELYFYTATGAASTSVAIDTVNLYHGIALATSSGTNKGFTHLAGQANAIASVEENSAGVSMKINTTGNHNLTAGQIVTHTGFTTKTAYRRAYVVQSTPTATQYVILGTFTGTDTGFMKRSASLQANTGSAGVYKMDWSIVGDADTATTQIKVEANKNITELDNMAGEKWFEINHGDATITGHGIVTVADGDYLWLSVANLTDATDFSVRHMNITVTKIG